jgi:hypothetical protein
MRNLFVISVTCALVSLLAVFCLSSMSIVPRPDGEIFRAHLMLVAGAFTVAWLCLAFWVRVRQRAAMQPLPPQWLRRLMVGVGVVYLFSVFLLVIG